MVRLDPAPTMERDFLGLRGLCVVGIVYCLNQDFQDYRIFRIGSVLYTFRTVGAWNVGFRSSTQPTRLHKLKVYATKIVYKTSLLLTHKGRA